MCICFCFPLIPGSQPLSFSCPAEYRKNNKILSASQCVLEGNKHGNVWKVLHKSLWYSNLSLNSRTICLLSPFELKMHFPIGTIFFQNKSHFSLSLHKLICLIWLRISSYWYAEESFFTPVCERVFSVFATPWTIDHQVPLPMEFSRQEYWSGFPFPTPGDLPDPGIEPMFLASPSTTWETFFTPNVGCHN